MKKYFHIQKYLGKVKAKIVIYNLSGRASIWWEEIKKLKGNIERKIMCKHFKKYFK